MAVDLSPRVKFRAFLAGFIVLLLQQCQGRIVLENGSPLVELDQGSYIGNIKTSRDENYFFEFVGLRYAKQPRRFEIPHLISEADKVGNEPVEAKQIPASCPQMFTPEFTFDNEDCLFLNVYVPMRKPQSQNGFPVMVWIHGGGYMFGSGATYEPQYFMDEDVILITVNYRLGALGFLSTGDNVIPGNLGLKDQIVALKWVQKNIQQFGGDNTRVTIFGESAGGSSVQFLMLSPLGKGLFHNAIMQSGSVSNAWAFDDRPTAQSKTKRLSEKLGCPSESSAALKECLMNKSVKEILLAQTQLYQWRTSPVGISPTIENVGSSEMEFLTEHPLDLLEKKQFAKVPLLAGFNENEGLSILSASLIKSEEHLTDLNLNFNQLAPILLEYSSWFHEDYFTEVSSAIREFYFKDKPIGKDTFQNLTNLGSDPLFMYGVLSSAVAHATEGPVYAYVLTFIDEFSNSITQLVTGDKELLGVAHGDDLQYLFPTKGMFPFDIPMSSRVEEFSKRLVKLWASFAQHGKPEATWGSAKIWPSISNEGHIDGNKPYLFYELNEDTKVLESPFKERKAFWDTLFMKYSKRTALPKDKSEL